MDYQKKRRTFFEVTSTFRDILSTLLFCCGIEIAEVPCMPFELDALCG